MNRSIVLQLLPTYIVIFFAYLGQSIGVVVLAPLVGADLLNLTPYWQQNLALLSGILMALYPTGQILGSNFIGHLSDHYGRRPIMLATMLIAPLAFLSIGLMIESGYLAGLMLCLIITGLCEGNITIAHSMIADLVEAKDRQRFFGYIHIATSLAFIIGPLMFTPIGWLAQSEIQKYSIPFYIISAICGANFILALLFLQESFPTTHKPIKSVNFIESFQQILTDNNLRILLSFNACVYFMIMGFFRFYPIFSVEYFDLSIAELSRLIAACAFAILLANLGVNAKLARRFQPSTIAIGSIIGMCFGLASLTRIQHELSFTLILLFISIMIALCLPCCHTLLSRQAETSQQGKVMGLNQSLVVLASAVSSIACGIMSEYHIRLPLLALCLSGCMACLLVYQYATRLSTARAV